MRAKVARLIHRQGGHTQRDWKRIWNRTPRNERHKLRLEFESNTPEEIRKRLSR